MRTASGRKSFFAATSEGGFQTRRCGFVVVKWTRSKDRSQDMDLGFAANSPIHDAGRWHLIIRGSLELSLVSSTNDHGIEHNQSTGLIISNRIFSFLSSVLPSSGYRPPTICPFHKAPFIYAFSRLVRISTRPIHQTYIQITWTAGPPSPDKLYLPGRKFSRRSSLCPISLLPRTSRPHHLLCMPSHIALSKGARCKRTLAYRPRIARTIYPRLVGIRSSPRIVLSCVTRVADNRRAAESRNSGLL
jgi:hypothetical protein